MYKKLGYEIKNPTLNMFSEHNVGMEEPLQSFVDVNDVQINLFCQKKSHVHEQTTLIQLLLLIHSYLSDM